MDKLDLEIQKLRNELADLERKRLDVQHELRGLERAAQLRPAVGSGLQPAPAPQTPVIRMGSPPSPVGIMSELWIKTLEEVGLTKGRRMLHPEILEIAKRFGFMGSASSCRDRVRTHRTSGLLGGDSTRGYFLTEEGRAKLSAQKTTEGPTAQATGPLN